MLCLCRWSESLALNKQLEGHVSELQYEIIKHVTFTQLLDAAPSRSWQEKLTLLTAQRSGAPHSATNSFLTALLNRSWVHAMTVLAGELCPSVTVTGIKYGNMKFPPSLKAWRLRTTRARSAAQDSTALTLPSVPEGEESYVGLENKEGTHFSSSSFTHECYSVN